MLSSPKKEIENFWYHYKWHTLIIVFFAVFLVIAIAQMTGRTAYDAHVLYTGPAYLDKETVTDIVSSITKASEEAAPANDNPADYSEDGVLTLDFNKLVYVPTELAETYQDNDIYFNGLSNTGTRGEFDNLIMIGEYVILFIDQSLYDETVGTGAFLTWEEALGYTPDGAYDSCGIMLSALPISSENGLRQLPDNTILCCRGKSYVNNFNKKVQNEALYNAQLALFRQIVEYVPTEK